MATTYAWNIVKMEAYPEKDGYTDVVFQVHWTLTGIDGEYAGGTYGSVGVELDVAGGYTPFAELTHEQVVSWVQGILGADQVALLQTTVATQIENKKNPPVVTPPLPWAAE